MLRRHQSFNIWTNTRRGSKSERLYEPRECPYFKYFLIPAIIGFMLLCILVNVDFKSADSTSKLNAAKNEIEVSTSSDTRIKPYSDKTEDFSKQDIEFVGDIMERTTVDYEEILTTTGGTHEISNEDNLNLLEKEEYKSNNHIQRNEKILKIKAKKTIVEEKSPKFTKFTKILKSFEKEESKSVNEKTLNANEEEIFVEKNSRKFYKFTNNTIQRNYSKTHSFPTTYFLNYTLSSPTSRPSLDKNMLKFPNLINDFTPNNTLHHRLQKRQLTGDKCVADKVNCALICSDGTVSYIENNLEDLQLSCSGKELSLTIINCAFRNGQMSGDFFYGDYKLKYLEIFYSNLQIIQTGAFKMNSVQNLQKIRLIENNITRLEADTFMGLKALTFFELTQELTGNLQFEGSQFFKPMAATLLEAKIELNSAIHTPINPNVWWLNTNLTNLNIMNLSNNDFRGVLDAESFRNFVAVRRLQLENCSLDVISWELFANVGYLYGLFLNNNHLTHLDGTFLEQIHFKGILLKANGNKWSCDCTNNEMIKYVQATEKSDYICHTPLELHQTNMSDVRINCDTTSTVDDTTTASTTTTAITPDTSISTIIATSTDIVTDDQEIDTTPQETSNSTITTSTTAGSTDDQETHATTTSNPNEIELKCYTINLMNIYFSIRPRIVNLEIYRSSSTSVIMTISNIIYGYQSTIGYDKLYIMYFLNNNHYRNATRISQTKLQAYDLELEKAYLFCVLHEYETDLSPFDCWSYFMRDSRGLWLSSSDIGWCITVVVVTSLGFHLIGLLVVYFILRQRPTWLITKSKRIIKLRQSTYQIALLPKESREEALTSSNLHNSRRETSRITYILPETCDDALKNSLVSLYSTQHKPPAEIAPTIPNVYNTLPSQNPGHDRITSCVTLYGQTENTVCPKKCETITLNDNESNIHAEIDYQKIDHYEMVQ